MDHAIDRLDVPRDASVITSSRVTRDAIDDDLSMEIASTSVTFERACFDVLAVARVAVRAETTSREPDVTAVGSLFERVMSLATSREADGTTEAAARAGRARARRHAEVLCASATTFEGSERCGKMHAVACGAVGARADADAREVGVGENYLVSRDGRAAEARTATASPWYDGSRARILACAHSRDGDRLLCCTAGGGAYVVPIWEVARDAGGRAAMRALASRGPRPASAVWWYRALELEREDAVVAICVGVDGEVRAWDADRGAPLGACVVGGKVASAELARGRSSQFLVINGVEGEVWTLMLERMTRVVKVSTSNESAGKVETTSQPESLPDAAGSPGFAAHELRDEYGVREGRSVTLSVCDASEDDTECSIIAALIDRSMLELYDVDKPSEPKSTHALPEHTVAVHVTEDLIFALVREPVFGTEDLSDLTSFTSSVHVLARRFGEDGSKSLTLQTFHVPRAAGVPRKFLPGPIPEIASRGSRRDTLRGCMLWASNGIYEFRPVADIQSLIRALMLENGESVSEPKSPRAENWGPIDRNEYYEYSPSADISDDERVKLFARVLEEDHIEVFIEAARRELKRQNFARARALFGKTGRPLKDFISLSLEVWEASQALTNFHDSSVEAYGGQANMSWLKTAAAAHAHLHAWCEASNSVVVSGAKDMGASIESRFTKLQLENNRSPEQAVKDLLRIVGESVDASTRDAHELDLAHSVSASVIAFEAARTVSDAVTALSSTNTYSRRIRDLFTVLLASTSTVETLHMLGGITANAMRLAEAQIGGAVQPWESRPLVFWDPNVTFYVTATQSTENLHDIVSALGLKSGVSGEHSATPLELLYDMLTKNELWELAGMALEAKALGMKGAMEIEMTVLFYLGDDEALEECIAATLEEDPNAFAWIVAKCVARGKLFLATSAAIKVGDFATAAMCHIAHVERLAAAGNTSEVTLQAELELGLESYVARVSNVHACAKCVEDVARCWKRCRFATSELEKALTELLFPHGHAESLQIVLQSSDLGFKFSGAFVLAVAKQRIADDEAKYAAKDGDTVETFWSRIKQDIAERMDSCESVQSRAFDAAELAALDADADPSFWVFTCGHRYGLDDLDREIDGAKERLRILDLPITSQLLESDYRQPRCAAACPRCACYALEHRAEHHRADRSPLVPTISKH